MRKNPEVQELRQWQREWREENENINRRVNEFWDKKMPDWNNPTPNASEDQLKVDNKEIRVESPTKHS